MKPLDPLAIRAQVESEELEAVYLKWESEGGGRDEIGEADFVRLLVEVRSRKQAIEQDVATMASRAIREGRKVPRRHQVFAFAMIAAFVALAAIVYLIAEVFAR